MRLRSVLVSLLVGSTIAVAQPDPTPVDQPIGPQPPPSEPQPQDPDPEPPAPPAPPPAPAQPAPVPPAPTPPASPLPPITINITNNNNGNNSNTTTQTNSQNNPQTNTQTNTQAQTNTQTQTVATPVATPTIVERGRHPTIERIALIAPKPAKWLAVGALGGEHAGGVRASLDLLGRGPFTIGVAATASERSGGVVGYLAWATKVGRLDVRAQVGLGVGTGDDEHRGRGGRDGRSDGDDDDRDVAARTITTGGDLPEHHRHGPELAPRGEAALLLGLPLGPHLGLIAGPVLSTSGGDGQDGEGHGHDRKRGGDRHGRDCNVDSSMMVGLRWGF